MKIDLSFLKVSHEEERRLKLDITEEELSFSDYFNYGLYKFFPISVLKDEHEEIVKLFGISKAKEFDWGLLEESSELPPVNLMDKVEYGAYEVFKELSKTSFFKYIDVDLINVFCYESGLIGERFENYTYVGRDKCTITKNMTSDKMNDYFLSKLSKLGIDLDKVNYIYNKYPNMFRNFVGLPENFHTDRNYFYKILNKYRKGKLTKEEVLNSFLENTKNTEFYKFFQLSIEEEEKLIEKWYKNNLSVEFSNKEKIDFIHEAYKNNIEIAIRDYLMENISTCSSNSFEAVFIKRRSRKIADLSKIEGLNDLEVMQLISFISSDNYSRGSYLDYMESLIVSIGMKNFLYLVNNFNLNIDDNNFSLFLDAIKYNFSSMHVEDMTKDEIYDIFRKVSIKSNCRYYDFFHNNKEFVFRNKDLFLPEDAPKEIKDAFYNKKLSIEQVINDKKVINYFDNIDANILYGVDFFNDSNDSSFSKNKNLSVLQVMKLFSFMNIRENETENILKLVNALDGMNPSNQSKIYSLFKENKNRFDIEDVYKFKDFVNKLDYSNSYEIRRLSEHVVNEIKDFNNLDEIIKQLEDFFLTDYVPQFVKNWVVFLELSKCDKEDIGYEKIFTYEVFSPVLIEYTKRNEAFKKITRNDDFDIVHAILFSDLLKTTVKSGNKNLKEYIKEMKVSDRLFRYIKRNDVCYDDLDIYEKKLLNKFYKRLSYIECDFTSDAIDVIDGIDKLYKKILNVDNIDYGNLDIKLLDRITRKFGILSGYKKLEDIENDMDKEFNEANERNLSKAKEDNFSISLGDLVKGVGNIAHFKNILERGSIAHDFLGSDAICDCTPIDTDLSVVYEDKNNFKDNVLSLDALRYGDILIVLNVDDRCDVTRENGFTKNDVKFDSSKIEAYETLYLDQFGIRCGFPYTNISYIIYKKSEESDDFLKNLKFDLAKANKFIPIIDIDKKNLFTEEEFLELRKKTNGLSYYNNSNYIFSDNLIFEGIEDVINKFKDNKEEQDLMNIKIIDNIKNVVNSFGIEVDNTNILGNDLRSGTSELVDRNFFFDKDNFKFLLKLDAINFHNSLEENIVLELKNKFNDCESVDVEDNVLTFKGVKIDDKKVDINISIIERNNKVDYSSDDAIKDRISNIYKASADKYNLVCANIMFAKEFFRNSLGGNILSDRGIENWILQNGGSFYDASVDFVNNAKGKNFEEFKDSYSILDVGEDYTLVNNKNYAHKNFLDELDEDDYKIMKSLLRGYLSNKGLQKRKV